MNNLEKDLTVLTTIPQETLSKLADLSISCLCDYVLESCSNYENITEVDIGIGKLIVKLEEDNIKFKFIPCKELCSALTKSVNTKTNPLTEKVEDMLTTKLLKAYKKML